jgi:hypothetical protein
MVLAVDEFLCELRNPGDGMQVDSDSNGPPASQEFRESIDSLASGFRDFVSRSQSSSGASDSDPPEAVVLVALDEAHVLARDCSAPAGGSGRTAYHVFTHVLNILVGRKVAFTVMSTDPQLRDFACPRNPSRLTPPFTELANDLFARGISSLEDVSKFEFFVKFGRPL